MESLVSDYLTYRGKCKEMSEALCRERPELRRVRGHYHCPVWGAQQHWWCVDRDGTVVDPSKDQFPSKGCGEYVEFDGTCSCEHCGKTIPEEDAVFQGPYALCSTRCAMRLVGL